MHLYDIPFLKANGEEATLRQYAGRNILIVNTATKCGLAPQFVELETLYNTYSHDDLMILGFPCGQFLDQEPGDNAEIQATCQINFGVTFPIFAKLEVNGAGTHPLYQYLKSRKGGWFSRSIKWNFTKFLIDREGEVIARYAPTVSPLSMKDDIEKLI